MVEENTAKSNKLEVTSDDTMRSNINHVSYESVNISVENLLDVCNSSSNMQHVTHYDIKTQDESVDAFERIRQTDPKYYELLCGWVDGSNSSSNAQHVTHCDVENQEVFVDEFERIRQTDPEYYELLCGWVDGSVQAEQNANNQKIQDKD